MFKQNKKHSKFVHLMGGIEGGLESSNEQSGEKPKDIPADAPKNEAQKAKDKAAGMVESGQHKAEALGQKNEFDKKMSAKEIKKKSKSYPRVQNPNSEQKGMIKTLKAKILAEVKRKNVDNPHGHRGVADMIGKDEHQYILVINHPDLLLFRSSQKNADAVAKNKEEDEQEDVTSEVNQYFKGGKAELTPGDAEYKKYVAKFGRKLKAHGQTEAAFWQGPKEKTETCWAVLLDKRSNYKGQRNLRVFKGEAAPA